MEVVLGWGFCSLENGFHALLRILISIRHSNRGSAISIRLVMRKERGGGGGGGGACGVGLFCCLGKKKNKHMIDMTVGFEAMELKPENEI